MAQRIPFLEIFSAFPTRAGEVARWEVMGASIDKRTRTIRAQVLCPVLPGPAMRAEVERALAAAYQVSRVELDLTVPAPNVEELALADGVYGEDMPLPEPPPFLMRK